jgi:N-acetylglucosaminyldiphosphoundecaprenol N-acetyl-beta-D-mannosaminyltransferase
MTNPIPRVDVLGVGISAISMREAVREIGRWIDEGERHYVCVTGVHGVMESQRDPELLHIHNESGLTTPDGMPMVWCSRWAGASHAERVYGPDLMLAVAEQATERRWSSYFYGGAPGVPEELAARLQVRYPGLLIAGTYSPPFRPLDEVERKVVVERINQSKPDIVWVGLGTPKQEQWMATHAPVLEAAALIGVGAAFDIHAGRLPQAPRWMQRTGLEWAYRVSREPRRLWKRYLINNPQFLLRIMRRKPHLRPPEV